MNAGCSGTALAQNDATASGFDMTSNNPVAAFRLKLTPRQRELLRTQLRVNSENAYDDIEENGDRPVGELAGRWRVFDRLPEETWTLPAWWRRQFARGFDDLTLDLEVGHLPYPRSVAEEVALMLCIADAQAALLNGQYNDNVAALPATPGDDDWQSATNSLVSGRHIDWQHCLDDTLEWLGDPPISTSWFHLFNGFEPRSVDRGFRR
jgi:hypothetical protein